MCWSMVLSWFFTCSISHIYIHTVYYLDSNLTRKWNIRYGAKPHTPYLLQNQFFNILSPNLVQKLFYYHRPEIERVWVSILCTSDIDSSEIGPCKNKISWFFPCSNHKHFILWCVYLYSSVWFIPTQATFHFYLTSSINICLPQNENKCVTWPRILYY